MGFKHRLQDSAELEGAACSSASNSKVLAWALGLALSEFPRPHIVALNESGPFQSNLKAYSPKWIKSIIFLTCFFPPWNWKSGFAVLFWNCREVPDPCSREVSPLGSHIRNGKSPRQKREAMRSPGLLTCLACFATKKGHIFTLIEQWPA